MLTAIGDMHLDKLERHIPGAYKSILSTFDKVVRNEIDRGTPAIVQLGDIFDNAYPDQIHIHALLQSLYKANDVEIYLIPGNHDFDDVNNYALRTIQYLFKIGFLKGKVFLKPEVVSIDGDKYLFCPHPYVVNDPPKGVRFCFGHFGFEGARGDNGYVIKSGNSPRGRWVLGDYHTYQRGKSYMYPGSLTQTKFSEGQDKYIARIEDKVQAVQISPDIKLGRVTIDSEETLANLDKNTYWSVNIGSKVKLSPDWARKYPHIVQHHAERDLSKRQRVLIKQVASEDPMEGFRDYLLNEGLSNKEADRTLSLLGM